ncbi:MAG: DUF1800 family protein [Planctomycetota bacterium]
MRLRTEWLLFGTLLTAGCELGTEDDAAPEDSLAARAEFSSDDVDHLLARVEFGVDPVERSRAREMGLAAYVGEMLSFDASIGTAAESEAAAYLQNSSDPVGLEGKFPSRNDITEWWLYLMLHSERPFQERLAMFWHDHFAISYSVLRTEERYMAVDYIEKLRRQGLGNFKDLVLTMARDPAMLEWLDGASNVKVEPNENFAREFFELFTVGADRGYSETDIQEAARAFTGYRNRLDATTNLRLLEFDSERKDVGAKVLFEDVILFSNGADVDDYELVVNATFDTLDAAGWLAEKLLLEFVTTTPSQELIDGLRGVILAEDYEMRPILRRLFLSEAFYVRTGELVRMPVDYGVGTVRATGLMVAPDDLRSELSLLGQVPGDPPSVFGWPQGEEWLSAAGMVERANLVRRLIGERSFQSSNGFEINMPSGTPDAAAVVDHFAGLLRIRLSSAERETFIDYLNTNVRNNDDLEEDLFDATDANHISARVRGLIYMLASHPDALER